LYEKRVVPGVIPCLEAAIAAGIKLFGKRYLGGNVDFVSGSPEGTTFRLRLPKKP
jgi:hypothetical protein